MKISIITINYNNKTGLERTIKSVIAQKCNAYEYIVVDGASKDGSINVIEKYSKYIDICIAESDQGPFDAMNKGIGKASGDYCIFMNSGDSFYDENVIDKFIHSNPTEDVLTGISAEHMGNEIREWKPSEESSFSLRWFYRHSLSHQSSFIKTEMMKRLMYDTDFRIVSDWLFFMIAFLKNNATYRPLPFFVSNYMDGGISRDAEKAFKEREQAIEKYYGSRILRDCHSMAYGLNEWDALAKKVDPNSKIGKIIYLLTNFLLKFRK